MIVVTVQNVKAKDTKKEIQASSVQIYHFEKFIRFYWFRLDFVSETTHKKVTASGEQLRDKFVLRAIFLSSEKLFSFQLFPSSFLPTSNIGAG